MVGFTKDNKTHYAGKHLLLDMWGCSGDLSLHGIKDILEKACKSVGATILFSHGHEFPGVNSSSGVIVLAESHASWHTWPEENNFIAIDIFMCGDCDPMKTTPILFEYFQPSKISSKLEIRGN